MPGENDKGGRQAEPMQTEEELSPQEYEHLLAQYENSFKNLQEGQIIRGRVLAPLGAGGAPSDEDDAERQDALCRPCTGGA